MAYIATAMVIGKLPSGVFSTVSTSRPRRPRLLKRDVEEDLVTRDSTGLCASKSIFDDAMPWPPENPGRCFHSLISAGAISVENDKMLSMCF